jgi:hypothetical protein
LDENGIMKMAVRPMNDGGMFGNGKFVSSIRPVTLLNGNSGLAPSLEREEVGVITFSPPMVKMGFIYAGIYHVYSKFIL